MKAYYLCSIFLMVASMAIAQPGPPPSRPGCEKPPTKSPDDCCKVPKLIQESIMKDCHSKPGPMECMADCVMSATGMMVNGDVKMDVAKKVLTDGVDAAWKTVIEKALDTCEQQSKSNTGIFDPSMPSPPPRPDGTTCNAKAAKYMICVHQQIYINCPTMDKDPSCAETKTLVEKCPEFLMMGKKP